MVVTYEDLREDVYAVYVRRDFEFKFELKLEKIASKVEDIILCYERVKY